MKHAVLTATLSLAILAGATIPPVNAQTGPNGPRIDFEQVDANADGKLTPEEMQAHRAARLKQMDTNGDSALSEDELRAGMMANAEARMEKRISNMMKRHDANGDGQLALDEFQPRKPGKMFNRADTDGDGAISKAEFDAMQAKRAKRMNKG